MRLRFYWLSLALCLVITAQCWANDSVKTIKGMLSGRLIGISPVKVDLEQSPSSGTAKEIPVNEIITIFFEGESGDLREAKKHVLIGHFVEALAELDRIKADATAREEIKQDIEYYKALCSARLALAGSGKISDAGRMMKSFVGSYPKSYHYFEGVEVVGDLLVNIQQYSQAAEYYSQLEKAPWGDYKMRAGVATGRALLAQGKNSEAMKEFDKILANDTIGNLADTQRAIAKLSKASVLIAMQRNDEAIKIAEEILQKTNPEDEQIQAHAYNVLGTAYRQTGRTKEALLAFLRVDLLYSNVLDAHAEALSNLADLWEQVYKPERAQRARKILEDQYKDSPWAKKNRGT